MNLFQIVQSIEELVYEVMLRFVMIPSTLAKVVSGPNWIVNYVTQELSSPNDKRFDNYSSPIILWLLLAVLPYFSVMLPFSKTILIDLKEQIFFISLFLAAGPIGFATSMVGFRKKPISKSNLKEPFYIQCYCFTPAYIVALPAIYLLFRNYRMGLNEYQLYIWLFFGAAFLWLSVVEIITLKNYLKISLGRACMLFIPLLFFTYMIVYLIVMALGGLLAAVYLFEGG